MACVEPQCLHLVLVSMQEPDLGIAPGARRAPSASFIYQGSTQVREQFITLFMVLCFCIQRHFWACRGVVRTSAPQAKPQIIR